MSDIVTRLRIVVLLFIFCMAACAGGDSGGAGANGTMAMTNARIEVQEAGSIAVANGAAAANGRDFGSRDVVAGATTALTITVLNLGTDSLALANPALSGPHPGEFVLSLSGFTNTVPAGAQTTFSVAFDPTSAGLKQATVSITHNAGNTATPYTFGVAGMGTTAPPPPVTPDISISGPGGVVEGNSGTKNAMFTVTLSQATSLVVTVGYQTQPGSTQPATAGTDYQTASGTLTFSSGQTTKTVNISVFGDTAQESNEEFDVDLSSSTNGTITTGTATCTILDDDTPVSPGGRVVMAYAENIWGAGGATAIQNFDYTAITHVIHGFVLPDANGNLTEHSNFHDFRTGGGWMPQNLPGAVHAAGKKIVFSVGGALPATNPANFAAIAASSTKRANFISNVVSSLISWGYDGVDIDYEWPNSITEGQQFTTLMNELYTAVKSANSNYVVMFGAGPGDKVGYKQWGQLANYCDYCFFFGYDWHYGLSSPAPVGPIKNPGQTWTASSGPSFEYSVRGAANWVLSQGFPASKLVIGLPFYNDINGSWSNGTSRSDWLAMTAAQRQAAINPDFMEANINGHYVTTPECIALKMYALLDINNTVLRDASNNPVVAGGTGWWEWGHENPNHGELTAAVKAWLIANP